MIYAQALYAIGGLTAVPITLMIITTTESVFGPWAGAGFALIGSEIAALLAFGVDHAIGRDTVSRIAGSRVNHLCRKLSERGVLTIITLRIVAVAPFTVINIIAGISEIRVRDRQFHRHDTRRYGDLADRIIASLRNPSAASVLVLVGVIALIVISLAGLRYCIYRKRDKKNE